MRKLLFLPVIAILCTSYSTPYSPPLTDYVPIMMDRSELNKSIGFLPAKPLKTTGKIYKFNDILFAIEPNKGVHVYDNSNLSTPVDKGFIRIPGCADITIKDGMMYADNAVDLVTIDITDVYHPAVVDRQTDVFPEMLPPDRMEMPANYAKDKRPAGLIIVGWRSKSETLPE